nr:hypothetical protein [Tanacetum cinerariifolium]
MEENEEEEEEEMDIEDEIDDPEIINPYEIEEGELPPLPADSDTSLDSEPEVKAEDEDENEVATVCTITHAPYRVQPFSGTTYVGSGSSCKVFAPGPIGKDVDILHRKVKCLAQQMFEWANIEYSKDLSVSMLEDQMRGLMLEDKEEKERLKKKQRVSQQEKEQMEQAFRQVVDWIRKQFGVEIPPCMGDGNVRGNAGGNAEGPAGGTGGPAGAPTVWEYLVDGYMKCNPASFHITKGAVEQYSELEDVIVPTSRSTLQLLPPIRRFLGKFYVGEGSSSNASVAHCHKMKDRAKTEFLTMNRLANVDRGMKEFKYDLTGLDSALRDEIQRHNQMEHMVTKLGKQVQDLKEDDVRKENKRLKMMLGSAEDCIRFHRERLARVS